MLLQRETKFLFLQHYRGLLRYEQLLIEADSGIIVSSITKGEMIRDESSGIKILPSSINDESSMIGWFIELTRFVAYLV